MPFKKLRPQLQEVLTDLDITEPNALQKKAIPIIKSGVNVYCTAPQDAGKTTTLIITTVQRLKCKAVGNAPRAVVLVEDKERALEVYEKFLTYTRATSLRVYVGHEHLHVDVQKSEIFMGIDILITTPKSMKKLFLLNGVSISELKIFSVDDAEFLVQKSASEALMAITQSIQKCQYVLYAQKMSPKLERYEEYFMEYSRKISV